MGDGSTYPAQPGNLVRVIPSHIARPLLQAGPAASVVNEYRTQLSALEVLTAKVKVAPLPAAGRRAMRIRTLPGKPARTVSLIPFIALVPFRAGRSRRANGSICPIDAGRAGITPRAGRPGRANGSIGAVRSVITLPALRPLRTSRPLNSLRPHCAIDAIRSGGSGIAFVTLRTLRPLRANFTLNPLRTLRADFTLNPLQSLRPFRSLLAFVTPRPACSPL